MRNLFVPGATVRYFPRERAAARREGATEIASCIMAAPTYGNAPLETIDVPNLKSSRFFLADARKLPYRDEQGRVVLCLVQRSLDVLKAGAVKAPEGTLEKLQRWERHTSAHFEKSPVTWEKRADGTWRSSDGEKRRTVMKKQAAAAATPPPPQPVAPRPASSSNGQKTEMQIRREKMEQLAKRVGAGGPAMVAEPKPAAKPGALDRQETSDSGKRHRAAIAGAASESKKSRSSESSGHSSAQSSSPEESSVPTENWVPGHAQMGASESRSYVHRESPPVASRRFTLFSALGAPQLRVDAV